MSKLTFSGEAVHDLRHLGPLDVVLGRWALYVLLAAGGADPDMVYVRLSNFAARRRRLRHEDRVTSRVGA